MSWRVANLCAERKFGSPVRKQIIMFLADKASDDGSGIYCSKGTIQRDTELGASTVKRAINDFLNEGIIAEIGRRSCANGYTMVYKIVLSVVEALGRVKELDHIHSIEPGIRTDGVQCATGTRSSADGVLGPERTPNHPKTIPKPPSRASAQGSRDFDLEQIKAAYPSDRIRSWTSCEQFCLEAIEAGYNSVEIRKAVEAYETETVGYTRSKVCFSDSWFRQQRWLAFVNAARASQELSTASNLKHRERLVEWIKSHNAMCAHITKPQIADLLASDLVTVSQLRAVGLSP